jgi:hypothetical protein
VPVNDVDGHYQYPNVVRFEIEERDLGSYRRAAVFLNSSKVDVVSVQHEFGIFGGPAGSHLLTLLREVKAPIVTTLHTVLLKPNADQHRAMQELIACSTRLVGAAFMAFPGSQFLSAAALSADQYGRRGRRDLSDQRGGLQQRWGGSYQVPECAAKTQFVRESVSLLQTYFVANLTI